jgi:hypothetical protein
MEAGEMVRTWRRDWGCVFPSEGPTGGRSSRGEGEQGGGRMFGVETSAWVEGGACVPTLEAMCRVYAPSCTFLLWEWAWLAGGVLVWGIGS